MTLIRNLTINIRAFTEWKKKKVKDNGASRRSNELIFLKFSKPKQPKKKKGKYFMNEKVFFC